MEIYGNIVTAITNGFAIIPLYYAIKANDMVTSWIICVSALASTLSHLFESHKHGLHGFGTPAKYSYYLNRCDVVCAVLLFGQVLQLATFNIMVPQDIYILTICGSIFLICNKISESDTTIRTQKRYLIFHNIWHIGIFCTLGYFLKIIY